MKTIDLKVGTKDKAKPAIAVPLNVAENMDDMVKLARGSEKVVIKCFNRGWRILNQDATGARKAFGEGSSVEDVAKLVAEFDPTQARERTGGGGRKKKVKISTGGKKKLSLDDLKAMLAAQGVDVEYEEETVAEGAVAGAVPEPAGASA